MPDSASTPPAAEPAVAAVRRPLAGLALSLVAGTLAGLLTHPPPGPLLAAAAVLWLIGLLLRRRRGGALPLHLAVVLVGWANCRLHLEPLSGHELARLMRRPGENLAVIGCVTDDPLPQPAFRDGEARWVFHMELEGVRRVDAWQRARGTLGVYWRAAVADAPPRCGDRIGLRGVVRPVVAEQALLPAPAGYRLDTAAVLHALPGTHTFSLKRWCFEQRRACATILARGLEDFPAERDLLQALILGYRSELPESLYREMQATGTVHIIAISGTHVVIAGLLAIFLLKAAGVPRPRWFYFLAPLLVIYTIATGLQVSALRACIMALVFWSALLWDRRPDGLSSLALAALLILAAAPDQLARLGFQLSFLAVLGLMLLYPFFCFRWPRLERDPWDLRPTPAWQRGLRPATRYLNGLFAASAAAWLATAPLTAARFNLFSPVALLANLFVIPAAGLVMLTGLLSLLAGGVFPPAAEVFNHANRLFIDLLLYGVDLAAGLPFGHWALKTPPAWWILAWYGLLLAGLAAGRTRPAWLRAGAVAGVALLLAWHATDRAVTVDLLDIGHGQAALINLPGAGDVLVDTGPRRAAERVRRHLRREGVRRLAALVVTRAEADHIGAAAELLDEWPVAALWCPIATSRSPLFQQLEQAARQRDIAVRRLAVGDRGELAGGVEWEVLQAPTAAGPVTGSGSLVWRVARGPDSVLFTGDADAREEALMLRRPLEVAAAVLVAGGHGSDRGTTDAWLDAVQPRDVILSVGAENVEGLPSPALLERLCVRAVRTWRTDRDGTVRVVFRRGGGTPTAPDIRALRPGPVAD